MKILIVNDDSIHAPGIALLAEAAVELGDVWVVAPAKQCSAMSQQLTLRDPMLLKRAEGFPVTVQGAWQLEGTPVDCVKVAVSHLLEDKPDVILSGVNNGYNVGFDIAYSATLGAAFEAARYGIPAIAFSAAGENHLHVARQYLPQILRELLAVPADRGEVWNVNFPASRDGQIGGILRDRVPAPVSMYIEHYAATPLPDGATELRTVGKPIGNDRIPAGTDAEAVRKGYISVGKVKAF